MTQDTIGSLIDGLFRLREERKVRQKKIDALISKENELKLRLIEVFQAQKATKGAGKIASCSLKKVIVPVAKDWAKINRWIIRHKDLSLLHKRISTTRYNELLEENPRGISGLESFEKIEIIGPYPLKK